MSWRGLLIVLLAAAALLSGYAVWKHRQPQAKAVAVGSRPDYVLRDFELIALNREGRESFTLRAPTLERHPGDATMTLSTPLFLLPNGEGRHWEIRAANAWVSADHKEIRLRGGVKANGPPEDLRPVTVNTDHLDVFPEQNRAATDGVVTIVQPGSILRGRGFAVSTTTKRYVFRSEVKSRYAPHSH
ncbi:MAG: LPS export ABC transporter periplasmic protein LptC [Lysobacteraceae bacterium]|nr:MAG: LPS export ABC transporter periplasmic protein LptC [Xanthomonadaceae bacterium]